MASVVAAWPTVALGEVLTQYVEYIEAPESRMYPKLSVKLYGRGVVLDTPADGSTLKMQRHQLAKAGQVILSEIWGKKGAIGIVPPTARVPSAHRTFSCSTFGVTALTCVGCRPSSPPIT
jgi:hypothetical protein